MQAIRIARNFIFLQRLVLLHTSTQIIMTFSNFFFFSRYRKIIHRRLRKNRKRKGRREKEREKEERVKEERKEYIEPLPRSYNTTWYRASRDTRRFSLCTFARPPRRGGSSPNLDKHTHTHTPTHSYTHTRAYTHTPPFSTRTV